MIERPANYDQLTSTGRAIVDDHVRAGITPPKMEPSNAPPMTTGALDPEIDDD